MANFDEHTKKTLVAIARQLYPHDFLDDDIYVQVIESVEEEADEDRLDIFIEGVKTLNSVFSARFLELSDESRVNALKSIERTPFFDDVRTVTLKGLYSNPQVWRYFGYEGPSAHLGGYIKRGFDDASWIPDE